MFRSPTRVTFRSGCLVDLPTAISHLGASRPLLVHGAGLGGTEWPAQALRDVQQMGFECGVFAEVEQNPRHTTVNRLGEYARSGGFDVIVGLGGGSTLDAAKAASMLASNTGGCETYAGKERYSNQPIPFVACPTTCGSGSEVTWVSVINRDDEKRKISVAGEGMFPDCALVDPDLLTSLPDHLVAETGLDALTHAIESYICRVSNPISDALSELAVAALFNSLPRAAADIYGQTAAREAIMRASTFAGMAFVNADLGAVHCLSESIGGVQPEAPHGLANALLLGPVLRYQLDDAAHKLAKLTGLVSGRAPGADDADVQREVEPALDRAEEFIAAVEKLVSDLGIQGFDKLGLVQTDLPIVAELAEQNGSNAATPTDMRKHDYLRILKDVCPPLPVH